MGLLKVDERSVFLHTIGSPSRVFKLYESGCGAGTGGTLIKAFLECISFEEKWCYYLYLSENRLLDDLIHLWKMRRTMIC